MLMDIQDTRRANLAEWLKTNSVPQKEKSLFSQLKGGASFGERLARRLETDYGMAAGYLDRSAEDNTNSPNREEKPPLSGEAESLIAWVTRLDGVSKQAPEIFRHIAHILALAHKGALTDNRSTVTDLISESEAVEVILNRRAQESNAEHAPRKRATRTG